MDDFSSDQTYLIRTLKQFKFANRYFSGMPDLLKRIILPHMESLKKRTFTVMDLGAGACDLSIWFLKLCNSKGFDIKMICVDHDPRVVRYARKECIGYSQITVVEESVLEILKSTGADYIIANHLLHHIEESQIKRMLSRISEQSREGFLINDVRRSKLGLIGFILIFSPFMRKSFFMRDGISSFRKAFTVKEVRQFASGMDVKIINVAPAHLCMYKITNKDV